VDTKPHLSATQLELIARCPAAYERRYINGEIIPPGVAAARGTGVHRGAETNFRQKIGTAVDMLPSQIVDAAVAGYEEAVAGGLMLTDDEVSRGVNNVIGETKDHVAELAWQHAKLQAPEYQPILVEEKVRVELPGPRDLLGVIDLLDTAHRITDFKTSAKAKPQSEADTSIQLTIYDASHRQKYGEPAAEVRLDVSVLKDGQYERQVLSTTRSDADFAALANRINIVNRQIQAGIFPPASPGAWNCCPRFCGYWASCPFVNSERKARAEAVNG
jgi:RecB family exonuclease